MKNIIFLVPDENDFFSKKISSYGYNVRSIYKPLNQFGRLARKIFYYFKIPLKRIWYNSWNVENSEQIIILYDSIFGNDILYYIKKKYPLNKLILWYWNPVNKITDPKKFKNLDIHLWSFDKQDCTSYGMKYNSQFYFKNLPIETSSLLDIDILFIGYDKGRLGYLLQLKEKFNALGLRVHYHIVNQNILHFNKYTEYKPPISYLKILELISRSKALLEIAQNGQAGLTLRALEAQFFSKMLITNNRDILQYNFYNKNNVFILEHDNYSDLRNFISKEYQAVEKNIVDYYSFENWVKRFNLLECQ